jgi:pimeloyl-ACP methyl ester carboxylesterase
VDLLSTAQNALRRYLVARGVSSSTVTLRGHAVHHYALRGTGSGPPVLLVHGLGGSANGYSRILHRLQGRFRSLHAMDLPGHGFSPLPAGGPLPLLELLDVLVAYADQVVGEPMLVVGNSLGGAMSVRLSWTRPDLVRALALVAPAGARLTPESFDDLNRVMNVRTTRDAAILTRRIFHRPPVGWLLFSPELRKMYGTPAVRRVFADSTCEDCLGPEELGGLRMPVLLLWGESDRLLPSNGVEYFRTHLPPHARIEVVKGFGHVPQVERPGQLVHRLLQFADEAGL